MGSDVAVRSGPLPTAGEWAQMKDMAKIIAGTEFVPKGLRGRPEAVLAALVAGHELGIGAMQALQHINVLDGKINYSAELLVAKIRHAGHSLTIVEHTDQRVTVKGKRTDTGDEHEVTWTHEMAVQAGLAGKQNWRQYERSMLTWRAITELSRFLYADVCSGLMSYTDEELGSEVEVIPVMVDSETGEIVNEEIIVAEAEVVEEKPKRSHKKKPMEAPPGQVATGFPDVVVSGVTKVEEPKVEPDPEPAPEPETEPEPAPEAQPDSGPMIVPEAEPAASNSDHVKVLKETLKKLTKYPEWGEENVLANCRSSFGREILKLDDLTEEETGRILKVIDDSGYLKDEA